MADIKILREQKNISQAELGRLIGVSQQHIQRFEKGYPIPIKYAPKLAEILSVDISEFLPDELKDIQFNSPQAADVAKIEMLDVTACCGNGVDNLSENSIGEWIMPLQEFRQITFADPQNIKMLKVVGDSMSPTLKAGDWVLVDISQQTPDVDGMYLLRMATGLAVKRLQIGLNDIQVVSDNKDKYKPIAASIGEIKVVGRVIYTLNAERVG